mmetsp:Transcript_110534/g.323388  ORF Transcript_110534/g.323388 Transcript_110534/m.323388 type:complete len:236 (+) Transcript_110534:195-902(+)
MYPNANRKCQPGTYGEDCTCLPQVMAQVGPARLICGSLRPCSECPHGLLILGIELPALLLQELLKASWSHLHRSTALGTCRHQPCASALSDPSSEAMRVEVVPLATVPLAAHGRVSKRKVLSADCAFARHLMSTGGGRASICRAGAADSRGCQPLHCCVHVVASCSGLTGRGLREAHVQQGRQGPAGCTGLTAARALDILELPGEEGLWPCVSNLIMAQAAAVTMAAGDCLRSHL